MVRGGVEESGRLFALFVLGVFDCVSEVDVCLM